MHSVDIDTAREDLKDFPGRVRRIMAQARVNHERLSRLHREAMLWAALLMAVEPDSPDIPVALRIAGRSAAAMFALASHPGESLTLSLGEGEAATLTGAGPDSTTHVGRWLDGFRLASVCRDIEALRLLLDTPTDVLRASSTKGDEYAYLYVDLLRGFWQSDPQTGDLLIAALEATAPERLVIADPDYVLDLVVPEIDIFFQILNQDVPAFNAALEKALSLHERYWSHESRSDEYDGFLALGPLAMASIGHDRGMAVEVESDYIPSWLVRGERVQG